MLYDNDDDFGVDDYREDVRYLFEVNAIEVKLIRRTRESSEYIPGDFLGIKTKSFPDQEEIIRININTPIESKFQLQRDGYTDKGFRRFSCYAAYDVQLQENDIIEFIKKSPYDINEGERFRVEPTDDTPIKGQFCYTGFNLIKI